MAWGSFFKKVGDVGKKILGGARKVVDFTKEKLLPGAKKILDVVSPFVPYGGAIQKGLDFVEDITGKADNYVGMAENMEGGKGEIPLKQFVGQKVRI